MSTLSIASARRVLLPVVALTLLVLQGCCCSKYNGYGGGCNSCGSCGTAPAYDYGAGYAPAAIPAAPGGCPNGNCGAYPSAFNTGFTGNTTMTAGLPPATMTATAPIYAPGYQYQPVPTTAAVQALPTH